MYVAILLNSRKSFHRFVNFYPDQVWQYYLLPEEEQRMPGVKNPMCNTFPRWMPVNVRIRIISFSELPLVTTGGGDLGADRRTLTQSAFWVSIILMIR